MMMKMVKALVFSMLIFLVIQGVGLARNSATVMVSATVVARVSHSTTHQEKTITITKGDIEKGYVEIPSAMILQIKTNQRNGYVLWFEGGSELFKEILVIEKGRVVVLPPSGGFIHQPYSGSPVEIKELSFRFKLKEDTHPGYYPFPFVVKAFPL